MAAVLPLLETIDDVGQAGGRFRQIGRVDLGDVAEADNLAAGAGAGDEGFYLVRAQVLRLVDDEEFLQERAAAHEVQ